MERIAKHANEFHRYWKRRQVNWKILESKLSSLATKKLQSKMEFFQSPDLHFTREEKGQILKVSLKVNNFQVES